MLGLQDALIGEDARPLGGLLRVHAAVEQIMQEGGVADRLELPAHHAERHHGAAVLDQHAGDQRVERALPRRDRARMAGDRVRKPLPRLCRMTPLSGAMMPVPNDENSELMNDTALPSRSTTHM